MCRARRRGPRTPLRTTDTSLHFAFVENSLVFVVPNIGGGGVPAGPPWPPISNPPDYTLTFVKKQAVGGALLIVVSPRKVSTYSNSTF